MEFHPPHRSRSALPLDAPTPASKTPNRGAWQGENAVGDAKSQRRKRRSLFVLGLAVALQACGASHEVKPTQTTPDAATPLAPHPHSPTFEDILHWAMQGEKGWDNIASGLAATFDLKPLPANSLHSEGPARLSDGRLLSFASISHPAKQIDIGVSETPCVSPTWAAGILGAKLDPVYQDAHGIDRGRVYDATANGMFVRINTTPETYRCVTAMHIYPAD